LAAELLAVTQQKKETKDRERKSNLPLSGVASDAEARAHASPYSPESL
jgi:hypothetical protein